MGRNCGVATAKVFVVCKPILNVFYRIPRDATLFSSPKTTSYPLAKLCTLCAKMLAGEWPAESNVKSTEIKIDYLKAFSALKASKRGYYFTHHSLRNLRNSAEEGCQLCRRFWDLAKEKHYSQEKATQTLHVKEEFGFIEVTFSLQSASLYWTLKADGTGNYLEKVNLGLNSRKSTSINNSW